MKAIRTARSRRRACARARRCNVEVLEGRELPATFTVSSLAAVGAGSLREAIVQANRAPGPDVIDFGVSGTIRLGPGRRAALPAVVEAVTIDGTTAPSFAGTPVVTVDFRGSRGLRFAGGSDGSVLRSLALVRARNAGVTLDASGVTIQGSYIGLRADGTTPAGNGGDGIRINASSRNNLIGRVDPVTSVSYYNAQSVGMQPVSGWQGIRAAGTPGQYLLTGTSGSNGLLYIGPISGAGGTSYAVNVPGAATTSVYGPDNLENGAIRLVGSYRTGDDTVLGFAFQGTTAELTSSGNYRTIAYPNAQFNYVHSTMGGLAVGNADGPEGNLPIGTGHAFIYDLARGAFGPDVVYPGSTSTTAYGIWHNGGTGYTIAGGYTVPGERGALGRAYLVDFDSATGQFTHWTTFDAPDAGPGRDLATHFEGISSAEKGVYTLAADAGRISSTDPGQGYLMTVRRDTDNTFGPAAWTPLKYTDSGGITSANSVAGNQVVGIVIASTGTFSYQATGNAGFQLSNVIGGNRGNGVGIYGSRDNRIAMNFIGTDATGMVRRGNRRNGVFLTARAARNVVGGQATGGNDPTGGVFVRPPQGNLISGNGAHGVRIDRGSTRNLLSGNFVGTDASGNAALGNRRDGVAIERADGNELIGCTFQQDPFVFYNVLAGNGGNGLRITDSGDTTVQANFLGAGANNATIVANGGDGLLVSGRSRDTQVGGVIPLGNVISGNDRNGIEVRDRASGFTSFNTFAGIFAFGGAAPNREDGIRITSTGGDNLVRTSIVSGDLGNGIAIGGKATGVQVSETAVGTNSSIMDAIPNGRSGILISGKAHGNAVGGFQPSVEPRVTVSANRRYGIEIAGNARDNAVFHAFVGTNAFGLGSLGNAMGGISLGPGTRSTTVGGPAEVQRNRIMNSGGSGVILRSSRGAAVAENEIAGNGGYGVAAAGVCTGSVVRSNLVRENGKGNANVPRARGLVYVP